MNEVMKSIEEELDAWAISKGYPSHREMAARLEGGKVRLTRERTRQYLQELEPIAQQAARGAAAAAVDATGLPEIPDFIKSIARMIRVFLLGYTAEECGFLNDRSLGQILLLAARDSTAPVRRPLGAGAGQDDREDGEEGRPTRLLSPIRP